MLKRLLITLIFSSFLFSCLQEEKTNELPNFVFILADDLGYGEVGVFDQEFIETPNIDQLAKEGMILTDHYTGSPVCAPARSVYRASLREKSNQRK